MWISVQLPLSYNIFWVWLSSESYPPIQSKQPGNPGTAQVPLRQSWISFQENALVSLAQGDGEAPRQPAMNRVAPSRFNIKTCKVWIARRLPCLHIYRQWHVPTSFSRKKKANLWLPVLGGYTVQPASLGLKHQQSRNLPWATTRGSCTTSHRCNRPSKWEDTNPKRQDLFRKPHYVSWNNRLVLSHLYYPKANFTKATHQNTHFSSLLQALLHSLLQRWSRETKEVATTPWFRAFHPLYWLERLVDALAHSLAVR